MREKWKKKEIAGGNNDGQPVAQKLTLFPEATYQPKISKTPSMRAITNYYNMPTDNATNVYDNLSFIPEDDNGSIPYDEPFYTISSRMGHNSFGSRSSNNSTIENGISLSSFRNETPVSSRQMFASANDEYEYAAFGTVSSHSIRTYGSEIGSEKRDDLMGSTSKLVSPKVKSTCHTWFSHLETLLCTITLAAGFGNLYRLPQTTLIRGELPFLVAYIILSILIGFPLLFLELGVGQLAQEGFIKIWRAVPFFKGVGYIKLFAGCFLTIYYPLYMALSLYYIIWMSKESLPFSECAVVKMTEDGYSPDGISGQLCIRKTFLESPYTSPRWFGIYSAVLFAVWALIILLSIKRTKSFVKSLVILFFPLLGFLISLMVKTILIEGSSEALQKFVDDCDWTKLGSADVWYYAAIQVFFSTNIGFGTFVTSAGVIYNKVNPLWMAVLYTIFNLIFGIGFTIMFYVFSGDLSLVPSNGTTAELHFMTLIYDNAVNNSVDIDNMRVWSGQIYAVLFFSGCISLVLFVYTLLKVIEIEIKRLMNWWQRTIIFGFVGFFLGAAVLLVPAFKLVHLLDHYIVGNLILLSVIIEVLAFITFYSIKRIQLDFEFILGRRLTKSWYLLWWVAPIVLLGFFVWALATLPLTGILFTDPEWLYGIGWGVVLMALIFIFSIGMFTVSKQEEFFTFSDKLKATLKPSRKWGPVDPILRYNWVQWHSKAKEGERDFTLKRRGTKDYTHSVKKYNKNQARSYNTQASSDLSTTSGSAVYHKNDQNQNNIRVSNGSSNYVEPYYPSSSPNLVRTNVIGDQQLRVTSLVDSFDPPLVHMYINDHRLPFKSNLNPLARPNMYGENGNDSSNSEGYGTFRKGPYIINDDLGHVCHRKNNQNLEATSL